MLRTDPGKVSSKTYLLIGLSVFGILIGVWHNRQTARGKSDIVTNAVRTITSPFVSGTHAIGSWISYHGSWLFRGRSIEAENTRLKAENSELKYKISQLSDADVQLRRLKQQLGFAFNAPAKRLASEVLAYNPIPGFATILISRGSRDGIALQDVVVAPTGLVGQVIDVGLTSSIVLLVVDQSSGVGGMVQRLESRATGICKIISSGEFRMTYVVRTADIKPGDVVVTSGLGGKQGVFPKGIPVGTVTSVLDDATGSSLKVTLKPLVDFFKLEEVYVLKFEDTNDK